MQEFLNIVKNDTQLTKMIDVKKLEQQLNEKVNDRQGECEIQLIPLDKNKKISNKYELEILQVQNNDLRRKIQNNRAKTVIRQNNLSFKEITSNGTLNRFLNIINKINISIQTKEDK